MVKRFFPHNGTFAMNTDTTVVLSVFIDICEAVGYRLRRGWHVNCEAKSLLNPESNRAILLTKGKIDQILI